MHIAIVSPPFLPVPPVAYGGTELFIADLAEGLTERGHDVTVYGIGASAVSCEVRSCYSDVDWPPRPGTNPTLKSLDHGSWAVRDVLEDDFELIHLNDAIHVPLSRFLSIPAVYTLHHPHEPELTSLYARYPDISYVAISDAQRIREPLCRIRTIYHGIRVTKYAYQERKDDYACFLGRMAPVKAPHLAIEVARRAGIRLKLAGEIQPVFREYWETQVAPFLDGCDVEYIGEANHQQKCELLSNARALLFPIQWHEPFGLVMIEAMACGTPVLAFADGSVPEVIQDGLNGRICEDVDEMAEWARDPRVDPFDCRRHVVRHFSIDVMLDAYEDLFRASVAERRHVQLRERSEELCLTSSRSRTSTTFSPLRPASSGTPLS